MNLTCRNFTYLLAVLACGWMAQAAQATVTNDRLYKMGESDPGAVDNGNVTTATRDDQGVPASSQFVDLLPSAVRPKYRTVSGRPDGVGGLGVEFTGTQFLRNYPLGFPETSFSALAGTHPGTLNYNTIADRGLQFWVRPTSTANQSIVMDTNQHGVRISGGFFSMRYNNTDFVSTKAVTANTWYHVMVVRPSATAGSLMFVNGEAVAIASGDYDHTDTAPLVVGANTSGTDLAFGGGTTEFFSGIVDDLKMFVLGNNSSEVGPPAGQNWGTFSLFNDNDYIKWDFTGSPSGDIDLDGDLDNADKNSFIAGWMYDNVVSGQRIADLKSYKKGDLNKDGITDIFDLAAFQNILTGAGLSAITAEQLAGVPEPATASLLALGMAFCCRRRRLK